MNIMVFGMNGMLGSTILGKLIARNIDYIGPGKELCDITNKGQILDNIAVYQPDVIINAAGIIPIADGYSDDEMMKVNAVSPIILGNVAQELNIKLIHISTDCVFSGSRVEAHYVYDLPDANDVYGLSKRAGELCVRQGATVLRTSFIGPQHGLLKWFLDQPQNALIQGWFDAVWSGSTVYAVADAIIDLAINGVEEGVQHLACERPITKLELLQSLSIYRPDIDIIPASHSVGRELVSTYRLPPIQEALVDLANYL